ncbi:CD109 antigen-like [Liolophura sinensis]|uniref:CD109 antigen-like n=1 Tax=Liolophura sinensis TaxID=3198878 RepID=UPI0031584E84
MAVLRLCFFLTVLRLCFFLAVLSCAAAKNTYVVLVPKVIRPGLPLNVSVNVLQASGDVHIEAKVTSDNGDATVAHSSAIVRKGEPLNIKLEIPQGLSVGRYKVSVQGSGGANFSSQAAISYKQKSLSVFVQTDKAVYKPSQTVQFRALAVHPDLRPYIGSLDIEMFDPKGNKIKQWLNVKDTKGVVENKLALSEQPVLGDWKIKVTVQGQTQEKVFTVDEYVLPKFEVTVKLPSYALTRDKRLSGTVKAMYTYGKPVKGTANISLKFKNSKAGLNTVTQTLQLDEGEKAFSVAFSQLTSLAPNTLNGAVLVAEANVTETLTGVTLNGSSSVMYHQHATKLDFSSSNPKNFKPGLKYTAYLRVSQQDGRPIVGPRSSVTISAVVTNEKPNTVSIFHYPVVSTHSLQTQTFTVPENGLVPIEIDIPTDKYSTKIAIKAKYPDAHDVTLNIDRMHSPSNSYIQIILKSDKLQVGDEANFDLKSTSPMTSVIYQVLSRGSIVSAGKVDASGQLTKTFSLTVTSGMAPTARIIVYAVRPDGEIVTESISFNVDGIFQNKVSVNFNTPKAQPGDQVDCHVTADPDSHVNILAVDQSVLLLKSGNDITEGQVNDELQTFDTIDVSKHRPPFFQFWPQIALRGKRMLWWPYYPVYFDGSDAKEVFENAGVIIMTDATVYHYKKPVYFHFHHGFFGGGFPSIAKISGSGFGGINNLMGGMHPSISHPPTMAPVKPPSENKLQEVDRVRKVFPETWLWTSQSIGSNGSSVISTTVPDTITSWVASAFAINHNSGLGVSPTTAKLQAFRPFFVSMNLPYSVVRGEQVALEAMVFNYMTTDMQVVVTLEKSASYRNLVKDQTGNMMATSAPQTQTIHIKAGDAKSVHFPIIPAVLGQIEITIRAQSTVAADAVQRMLLVEAEGVPREYNHAVLVDLTHNSSFSKVVPISFPPSTVYGSQHIRVSAVGDLMGPTIHGLDSLLRMPTGCGEQTMLNFAPDIFVSKYLSSTQQLTGALRQKALGLLEKGYQRELTYQHKDGSFSAFGDRDSSGSMWLTAFVIKSFHQAKPFIFVDDATLVKAITWILSHQKSDGSFPEPGRIIHKNMQGGSASGVALTSFVLISLLENSDLDNTVEAKISAATAKSREYLENEVNHISDDYTMAITTYALMLAKSSRAQSALMMLNHEAVVKDGTKHWEGPIASKTTNIRKFWRAPSRQSPAIAIETTAYGLLSYAEKRDLVAGLDILKWITSQRNAHGGFSSTQDTVVALQALSEFAEKIFSPTFDVTVKISDDVNKHNFRIQRENSLVFQTAQMNNVSDHVTVSATGSGMALVQVSVDYHVEQDDTAPSFDVQVKLLHETMHSVTIQACAQWLQEGSSGMAVEEIGIPTGFQADRDNITLVDGLKRIETSDKKLLLYFDEISTTPTCITVRADRTALVAKSKPAAVRIYDYYEPDNQKTVFYQSHVLEGASICDVCGADCGCN